jgi:hypothetical protein
MAERVLDERDAHGRLIDHLAHRQADAIDCDRTAAYDKVGHGRRKREIDQPAVFGIADGPDLAHAVDVPLHDVATQRIADPERPLEIHPPAGRPVAHRCSPDRCAHGSGDEPVWPMLAHGQANAIHGNALTVPHYVVATRQAEFAPGRGHCHAFDRSDGVDESCEH